MKLIAFVGFKSSGKNTAALPLITHGYQSISFADSIKDCLATIFCWERQLLEGITEESRLWRETIDSWWAQKLDNPSFSPRWAMTHFGTDIMRTYLHPDIWVLALERRLTSLPAFPPSVIPDVRFKNEMNMVRSFGGDIYEIRRGAPPSWLWIARQAKLGSRKCIAQLETLKVHCSEYEWIDQPVDAVITNDDTVEALHAAIVARCLIDG